MDNIPLAESEDLAGENEVSEDIANENEVSEEIVDENEAILEKDSSKNRFEQGSGFPIKNKSFIWFGLY